MIAAAAANDEFVYDAEGTPRLLGIEPLGDWGGSVIPQDRILFLEAGSQLRVKVGASPERQLAADGSIPIAIPVSYLVSEPGHQGELEFGREWISMSSGQPTQIILPTVAKEDDRTLHMVRFTRYDRVPLLLASLFWEQELSLGSQGTWSVAHEQAPGVIPGEDAPAGELSWKVKRIEGNCEVAIEVKYDVLQTSRLSGTIQLAFAGSLPLPTKYVVQDDEPSYSLQLDLVAHKLGTDRTTTVAPIQPVDLPPTTLGLTEPSAGCLPSAGSFPVSCGRARATAEEDMAVKAWLDSHPGAAIVSTIHRLGKPGSGILTRWEFIWTDGTDASRVVVDYDPSREVLPGIGVPFTVTNQATGSSPVPQPPLLAPTTEGLEALHQFFYSTDPEVLRCDWAMRTCGIGTHENTGMARATSTGATVEFSWSGLLVELDSGLVLQETAYGPPGP